ncbi:MAG: hypothetical protein GY786_21540 [Proteobacteria bacterium]|nr:hypothetical protein [Pseudomonadota bacterium]
MNMIMGSVFFLATLFFAATGALSHVAWWAFFWNAPSFLIVFVPAAVFAISTTSLGTLTTCIRTLFAYSDQLSKNELNQVYISLRVFGDTGFFMGVLGSIISIIIMGHGPTQTMAFGPNISVAILTTCYGLVIKIGSYIAEKRLNYQSIQIK